MGSSNDVYKERFPVADLDQLKDAPDVHVVLFRVWQKRASEAIDGLPNFDVLDLPGEILSHLAYSDCVDGGKDFRLRVVGDVLAATLKSNFVGRLTSEMPFPKDQVALILDENRWAVEQRTPLYVRRRGAAQDMWSDMTRLIVPVSDGRGGVRVVMSFYVVEFTHTAVMQGIDKSQTVREPKSGKWRQDS
jgi:hypothetical protein